MSIYKNDAQECRTWPFEEAKAVLKRLDGTLPEKGYILFETGYGPSGLPHIGTFGEVCRTAMVMRAFKTLSDMPAKMICFSDDMDGLRKVPSNVPNQALLEDNLGKPLSSIPDPFEKYDSFAAHNNARLREFIDAFGFDYEFMSSTQRYQEGGFDDTLLAMLHNYDDVNNAVLPLLGEERKATYSPFLPISPKTGKVLQVPLEEVKPETGTIVFKDEDGELTEIPVTKGHVKCQWRADWALRWHNLDVDYEMAGEDLKTSADVASKIVRRLGGNPPVGFRYKLFLDEDNQKISKSKGNGLAIEEWLTYAPTESLSYYMFLRPTSGKKLYFDVIPKAVDEYITHVSKMPEQDGKELLNNPAWYIHDGNIPNDKYTPVSFALLLNLVNVANTEDKDVLWAFLKRYSPDASPETHPFLDDLIGYALRYYKDFVLPEKEYRMPDERERAALSDLVERLEKLPDDASGEDIQTEVFSAGKENGYDKKELRQWFQAIYEVCLGQSQGPRFGSFIELYGKDETIELIRQALDGQFAKAA